MTRALVTGATGFVGANLVRRLVADGAEVHAVARAGSDRWRLAAVPEARVHEADVTDAAALDAVVAAVRPERVFHLAAFGAYSWQTDATRIVTTNVVGTLNVLESAVGSRVVGSFKGPHYRQQSVACRRAFRWIRLSGAWRFYETTSQVVAGGRTADRNRCLACLDAAHG